MTSYLSELGSACAIGLGTFPFASPFREVSPDEMDATVTSFLEAGGKYIDTAPTYAFGEVERRLGRILARFPRDQYFINTSCGYVRDGDGYRVSARAEDVVADAAESLSRLNLDFFDSYILHIPDPATPLEETAAALRQLKESGIARRLGLSNVTPAQLRAYADEIEVDVVQQRFSLINRSMDQAFIEACYGSGACVVAYQVIERGLLTTTFGRSGVDIPVYDLRSKKPEFAEDRRSIVRRWVHESLAPIAENYSATVEAIAVAWACQQEQVGIVQCGASTPQQVDMWMAASALLGNRQLLTDIERAYETLTGIVIQHGFTSVRDLLGLEGVDPLQGLSASGK